MKYVGIFEISQIETTKPTFLFLFFKDSLGLYLISAGKVTILIEFRSAYSFTVVIEHIFRSIFIKSLGNKDLIFKFSPILEELCMVNN